jgi:hypothetical protein
MTPELITIGDTTFDPLDVKGIRHADIQGEKYVVVFDDNSKIRISRPERDKLLAALVEAICRELKREDDEQLGMAED